MPTVQGGSWAKNFSTAPRRSWRRNTTLPEASAPRTWNTFFAKSKPIMLILSMDGSLVWSNRHHQSGTLMPSGAVHTIFARSPCDEAIHRAAYAALDCFAHRTALCAEPVARNDG